MTLFNSILMKEEDEKEFITNLYRQYHPLLKKCAYSIIRDVVVVDDLIHDAFLKLISKTSLLRSLNCYKIKSYIVITLKNICLDYLRKEMRHAKQTLPSYYDEVMSSEFQASTEEEYLQHEELKVVAQILFKLPKRDRLLLYLKYYLEMKDKEIAYCLDIPPQHVRQYAARARHRARIRLSQYV